jgi:hypothetical protein
MDTLQLQARTHRRAALCGLLVLFIALIAFATPARASAPTAGAAAWAQRLAAAPRQGVEVCSDGTATVTGTVRDEAGQPVGDAEVAAFLPMDDVLVGYAGAMSAADGGYRLTALCAGENIVAGFKEQDESLLFGFWDSDGDGNPDPITLSAGQTVDGINLVLAHVEIAPPDGACRDADGTVQGTVRDEAGQPVADALVIALGDQGGYGEASSGADGRYTLSGLCLGQHEVYAQHSAGDAIRVGAYDADGDGLPDPVELTAADPSADGIDISLAAVEPVPAPPAGCEDGPGTLSGTLTGPGGAGVEGATVYAFSETGTFREVRSGPDGAYRVEGLCPEGYLVVAIQDGHPPLVGVYDVDGDGVPDPVTLTDAQPSATDVDIAMTPLDGSPQAAAACTLAGQAAGATGTARAAPRCQRSPAPSPALPRVPRQPTE